MQSRTILGALAGVALAVSVASAQDTSPPEVFQITTLELDPGTMMEWREGLRKQAAAARELNLPAAEVGWWAMNDNNRTMIVRRHARDELFSNPQVMQKIRAADSARAADVAASFQGGRVTARTTEIVERAPDLSYQPATPLPNDQWSGIIMQTVTVAPGQGRAFREAVQAMNKVLADLKYPYARSVSFVRMGEGAARITTFIDTRENYFGKNSVTRLLEANPAAREDLRAAYQAFLKTVTNMRTTMAGYARDLSYPPEM